MAGLTAKAAPVAAWSDLSEMKAWLERAIAAAADTDIKNAQAAEWLLDNDFQVQRAILQISEDMPRGFYDRLPSIGHGDDAYPRIYGLAHALLEITHLQISLGPAIHFIEAYQDKAPLTIAELWAFPTMLRIACIELLVTGFGRLFENIAQPFPTGKGGCMSHPADPTECVARAVANMGVISSIQWKDFFDQTSRVEAILRNDPADIYARMDFETRDNYRRMIERLAERANLTEWDVAHKAIAHSQQNRSAPFHHVGHWLIGTGQSEFEDDLQSRRFMIEALGRQLLRNPAILYLATLSLFTLAGILVPALYLASIQASREGWVLGIALSALPVSVVSITLVNWLVTLIFPPRVLPKLDFENGIAPDCRTVVVMPVIVAHSGDVERILLRLESHYLSNLDPLLRFVLLTDLTDADEETCLEDEATERELVRGIEALNVRYGETGDGPFHLLHRPRLYNPAQGCWMGWERKRGKLEQFNAFLLTGDHSPFSVIAGSLDALDGIRFVVTADADTRLPPGVVNRMVGTLAHPLNQACFDPKTGRVTSGYTVLQPRVEIAPDTEERSLFTRFFGGDTAIDIYSRAVSDVYQDLVGSGIFVGKGIYDVAAFERSLRGRIPENNLLSHDLFEGLHGRAGLASDIIIFEGFPSGYLDYARRWHRWVRGDWQILPWLFPIVPGRETRRVRNPLSWFDKLKISDNLRRSLVPISIVALLLGGWLVLPGNPLVWTLFAIVAPGAYLFTDLVTGLASGRRRGVLQSFGRRFADHVGRWALAITFVVSDAAIATHAITVTLWRLAAGKNLLEWTSAAHMSDHFASRDPRRAAWREMWISPFLAALACIFITVFRPEVLTVALPLLLIWFLAPEVAVAIMQPIRPPLEEINADDRLFLRKIARRTWLYFETFVRPEDSWLPPDNYQEPPDEEIAHRTSPTNVGIMLLAAVTAWKLGHISLNEFATRLRNTLDTLDRLERYRGHMLNWYETRTLRTLEPRYVSTVDSGNLAVSLVVMSEACREAQHGQAISASAWDGLLDEVALLADALEDVGEASACLATLASLNKVAKSETGFRNPRERLDRLSTKLITRLRTDIHDLIMANVLPARKLNEAQLWMERIDHHLASMMREEEMFRPWLAVLNRAPSSLSQQASELAEQMIIENALARHPAPATINGWQIDPGTETALWRDELTTALDTGARAEENLYNLLADLADRAARWAHDMDFGFLFDKGSRLFHIGYNVSADRMDQHHYDLLASEARLASFFAIAKGDVPFEHWFHLGRPITKKVAGLALVSWNGSMFEYLMPNLFLRSDPKTLLGQSDRTAIDLQRAYGESRDIPWGISESAYASMGSDRAYRYHAFGVPGLGLRRGLEQDLVIAPYASALALAVRKGDAIRNLRKLAEFGMIGRYGFYEAIDFTSERVSQGQKATIVRSYMVHHLGMSLASIGNALCEDMLVRWFHDDPHVRTVDLLLNERIPWELPPELERSFVRETVPIHAETIPALHPWHPELRGDSCIHAIGNGRMTTLFGAGGSGLQWQGLAMTASTPGPWLYLRDQATGQSWDATPDLTQADNGDSSVILNTDRVECHRREHDITVTTQISVVHGDDVEIRRVTLVNDSDQARTIELINYAEIILAPSRDAARHPAFSKLFVHSEYLSGIKALLFTRRVRNPNENPPFLLHRVIADDDGIEQRGFETDRAAFLGRLRSSSDPAILHKEHPGNSEGWTLDPVLSLNIAIDLPPHGRREVAFVSVAAASRATALEIADRYATLAALEWAMDDAVSRTARDIYDLGLTPDTVPDAYRLLARMAGPDTDRNGSTAHKQQELRRTDLWSLGISGDHPILLLRAGKGQILQLIQFLLTAQKLCRLRGVSFDLVVLHEGEEGYIDPVREGLLDIMREHGVQDRLGQSGGIHLVGSQRINDRLMRLLRRVARITLDEAGPAFRDQFDLNRIVPSPSLRFVPMAPASDDAPTPPLARPTNLLHDNGIGGFAPDDGAYIIHLEPGETTPAPWSNILANESFGTIVTEAGLGFSWAINSGENRLTPWSNDPVCDPQSECLYLRDEENAHLWTISPKPSGGDTPCQIKHGAGYTAWERASEGLQQEMLAFVPSDDPVKIVRLRLRNMRPRTRRITATYYAQWLLGTSPSEAAPLRRATYDPAAHALLAINPWSDAFGKRIAFLAASKQPHSLTTSRNDFLGPRWDIGNPEALQNWSLGGKFEAIGDDCCAAYQVHLDIPPDAVGEVIFILGQGQDRNHAQRLIARWKNVAEVETARQQCLTEWTDRLGAMTVTTQDPAFDTLVNRWLPYQAVSSRLRARAGFYQAGGAFGFRDQLQDVLALRFSDPAHVRRHILEAAAHQFEEGDVLHWWHPPTDAGVRTRCSDDMLWLPYVVGAYIEATGDRAILTEKIPFLRAPQLAEDESDRYSHFDLSPEARSLFEHCERALERAHRLGHHNLPLMGDGDWNDGMNRIGEKGRGESVWLGWFLIATINYFVPLCEEHGRPDLTERWLRHAADLTKALEAVAWDGEWYMRAFDDDGRPWGTATETECRIDSIAQSWARISEAGNPLRVEQALRSARKYLIRKDDRLVRLLDPPFDATPREPGYIKSYPPGIRENGGQYTHAAAWLGIAFALSGDGNTAMEVFRRINPICQTLTPEGLSRFRTEPYVLAADVAGTSPHIGRGGWSWYTGAAAWTWRLAVENILGLRLIGGKLRIEPCLPTDWKNAEATLRRPDGNLHVRIDNPDGISSGSVQIMVDGALWTKGDIAFPTDGSTRQVNVRLRVR